jgi:succinate-acetate transporter protein
MVIASFLEFFLGYTFQFAVFGSFGAFWLSFGATLTPYFNAAAAYQPESPNTAFTNPTFNATFAYFPLYMALLCFIYFIASLKTNLVLMLTFLFLVPMLGCLSGMFFKAAEGVAATNLMAAAGACGFVVCILCWYLLTVQILASVAFPLNLPVGDLDWLAKRLKPKRS